MSFLFSCLFLDFFVVGGGGGGKCVTVDISQYCQSDSALLLEGE
jgi:hypothetical protein